MWRIDRWSSLCLVHRSTRPAVNVMSPKPLFTQQKAGSLLKVGHNRRTQTLYPGHKHIHSHYCVPAEGALIVCESKVTPTCRATYSGCNSRKSPTAARLHLHIGNAKAKTSNHKMCFQGQIHQSICQTIWLTSELTAMTVQHERWRQNKKMRILRANQESKKSD